MKKGFPGAPVLTPCCNEAKRCDWARVKVWQILYTSSDWGLLAGHILQRQNHSSFNFFPHLPVPSSLYPKALAFTLYPVPVARLSLEDWFKLLSPWSFLWQAQKQLTALSINYSPGNIHSFLNPNLFQRLAEQLFSKSAALLVCLNHRLEYSIKLSYQDVTLRLGNSPKELRTFNLLN